MDGDFQMETVSEFLNHLEYLNRFNKNQKLWLRAMVSFIRCNFPEWEETTFCRMPTYYWRHKYITFSATKDCFYFHTNDETQMLLLKRLLVNVSYGKRCVRIPLSDTTTMQTFFDVFRSVSHRVHERENLRKIQARSNNILNNDSVAKKLLQ
jgi:hypothetical protein